jgi:hypothetical protein
VLNGEIPDVDLIRARIELGAGLVLVLGPNLTEEQVGTVLGIPLSLTAREDAVSLTGLNINDPLLTEIPEWCTPSRLNGSGGDALLSVQPLVPITKRRVGYLAGTTNEL